jgi:hypothetical protein
MLEERDREREREREMERKERKGGWELWSAHMCPGQGGGQREAPTGSSLGRIQM